MKADKTNVPGHTGQDTVSSTSDEDRIRAPIKESMQSYVAYEKTVDEANKMRDTARRVKQWETEMARIGKANVRTMRQRARGYY